MTTIYLIRHGQTDWNKEKIFRGRADLPLNKRGREEARALSEHLEHVRAHACYSSPLSRAVETAAIVARPHSLDVKLDEGITDMDYGEWQGLPDLEASKRFGALYQKWHDAPHRTRFPGGESLAMVRKRALRSLDRIRTEHPEATVLVVAHRVVTKVIMCAALGLGNSAFWRIRQDNCAFNILELSAEGAVVVLMNDTCHMKSAGIAPTLADF
ncbi:MAG: histidine phosphatase family protein [Candidatus Abyssobacteria bacterium SURF_17]|uniref:Histidine phosphatase family protein n=1 Tax=Candidatus Abyssobacteria bacterium SURF_17 TaxID=2093361 RepID=A0A419EQK5_9BACT|nr:MAG: histidine phosphatase family protein [Candidatus Abyssubacteria bacterium SURF_17]